ncbi:MAG: uracil phosphoribosyltransferase [Terrimicrobiaceae bacterium]
MRLPSNIHLVSHPLIQTKVATLRDKTTGTELFRRTLGELAVLVAYEATRHLPVEEHIIETPLGECGGHRLATSVTLVPILRAGLGMAEAILRILPSANVGHVGMARNEHTFLPESYFFKAPPDLATSEVFLVDPMLATGNSSADAADELKAKGATKISLIALVGCQPGAELFLERHPDIPVFLAVLDPSLNEKAYIVPGLGDAGDRYFGT